MYENRHGRFTAVDPLLASGKSANPQTFNRFVYVGNNPLLRIDPTGEEWWDVINRETGRREIAWFDDDPDEDLYDVTQRWTNYIYKASDGKWYALDPASNQFGGFYEYERAKWQYGKYVDFNGGYDGFIYDMFNVKDFAHMVADMKTLNQDGAYYYFAKIAITNGAAGGITKFFMGGNAASKTVLGLESEAVEKASTALVPKAIKSLGDWGEKRLGQVLNWAGEKPSKAFITSTGGRRFVDRLVNGIAHEAKAGLNVKLTSSIEKQILKDVQLIKDGQIKGAHWHFFQGVEQEVLDFLTKNGIPYTVH